MAFPPNFTNNWDTTFPPDTQLANLLGQDLRNLRVDVMQRLSLLSGTLANRPAPEILNATWGGAGFGLLYFATDTNQVFQWNGAAWIDVSSSIGVGKFKSEGTNIVPVTVANTVAQTDLQVIPIGVGDIGIGQTFYFEAFGFISATGGAPTCTISVNLGGTGTSVIPSITGGNNTPWAVRGFLSCLTTGIAGTLAGASIYYQGLNVFIAGGGGSNVGLSINTTIANNLKLQAQWSAASAQNSITQNFFNCYRVG